MQSIVPQVQISQTTVAAVLLQGSQRNHLQILQPQAKFITSFSFVLDNTIRRPHILLGPAKFCIFTSLFFRVVCQGFAFGRVFVVWVLQLDSFLSTMSDD